MFACLGTYFKLQSIQLILYSLPIIARVPTDIINVCLSNSIFYNYWKCSIITPVPKNESPSEWRNLRPVSILLVLSKILEKVMATQLLSHVNKYNV